MNNSLKMKVEHAVSLRNVSLSFKELRVISNVEFDVQVGEVVAIVGPSGCGKSTLLRVIAGLEHPQHGSVEVSGEGRKETNQCLRYLFQDYDSFPWLTVFENVQVGSGVRPHPSADDVAELLDRVGLSDHSHRYPAELSGGMRKRLGLARALVRRPQILLLDEPFASLDVDTRIEMYGLIQELAAAANTSMVLVTHDLTEAVLLSDRVLVSSHRPLTFRSEIPVPLDRPRTAKMMDDPAFLEALRCLRWEFSSGATGSDDPPASRCCRR